MDSTCASEAFSEASSSYWGSSSASDTTHQLAAGSRFPGSAATAARVAAAAAAAAAGRRRPIKRQASELASSTEAQAYLEMHLLQARLDAQRLIVQQEVVRQQLVAQLHGAAAARADAGAGTARPRRVTFASDGPPGSLVDGTSALAEAMALQQADATMHHRLPKRRASAPLLHVASSHSLLGRAGSGSVTPVLQERALHVDGRDCQCTDCLCARTDALCRRLASQQRSGASTPTHHDHGGAAGMNGGFFGSHHQQQQQQQQLQRQVSLGEHSSLASGPAVMMPPRSHRPFADMQAAPPGAQAAWTPAASKQGSSSASPTSSGSQQMPQSMAAAAPAQQHVQRQPQQAVNGACAGTALFLAAAAYTPRWSDGDSGAVAAGPLRDQMRGLTLNGGCQAGADPVAAALAGDAAGTGPAAAPCSGAHREALNDADDEALDRELQDILSGIDWAPSAAAPPGPAASAPMPSSSAAAAVYGAGQVQLLQQQQEALQVQLQALQAQQQELKLQQLLQRKQQELQLTQQQMLQLRSGPLSSSAGFSALAPGAAGGAAPWRPPHPQEAGGQFPVPAHAAIAGDDIYSRMGHHSDQHCGGGAAGAASGATPWLDASLGLPAGCPNGAASSMPAACGNEEEFYLSAAAAAAAGAALAPMDGAGGLKNGPLLCGSPTAGDVSSLVELLLS